LYLNRSHFSREEYQNQHEKSINVESNQKTDSVYNIGQFAFVDGGGNTVDFLCTILTFILTAILFQS